MILRRVAAVLLLLGGLPAAAVERADVVITLRPADFQSLPVTQISRLSLMRYSGSRGWEAIPFQIDEMDEHSLVWFPGNDFRREGRIRDFDADDELLFMLSDAGQKAPKDSRPGQGQVLAAVSLLGADRLAHWVYLVADSSQRSKRHYVNHDPDSGVTRTPHYLLTTDPDNELNWRYLGYEGYTGPADASIIDSLRMRMSGGVLFRFARVTLDNDNLKPELVGFKIGPIRSVMHLETRVVFAGLPMMRMHVQAHRYANHYEAHTYARIPALYKKSLREPVVSVSVDGNTPKGSRLQTARGGERVAIVDGVVDDDERFIREQGLATDASWLLFDSEQGFALLTVLNVPDPLRGIPLALIYEDTRESRSGERFPGRTPELGYRLEGWPPTDELRFSLQLFFDSAIRNTPADEYVRRRSGQDLSISVQSVTQAAP